MINVIRLSRHIRNAITASQVIMVSAATSIVLLIARTSIVTDFPKNARMAAMETSQGTGAICA